MCIRLKLANSECYLELLCVLTYLDDLGHLRVALKKRRSYGPVVEVLNMLEKDRMENKTAVHRRNGVMTLKWPIDPDMLRVVLREGFKGIFLRLLDQYVPNIWPVRGQD